MVKRGEVYELIFHFKNKYIYLKARKFVVSMDWTGPPSVVTRTKNQPNAVSCQFRCQASRGLSHQLFHQRQSQKSSTFHQYPIFFFAGTGGGAGFFARFTGGGGGGAFLCRAPVLLFKLP